MEETLQNGFDCFARISSHSHCDHVRFLHLRLFVSFHSETCGGRLGLMYLGGACCSIAPRCEVELINSQFVDGADWKQKTRTRAMLFNIFTLICAKHTRASCSIRYHCVLVAGTRGAVKEKQKPRRSWKNREIIAAMENNN